MAFDANSKLRTCLALVCLLLLALVIPLHGLCGSGSTLAAQPAMHCDVCCPASASAPCCLAQIQIQAQLDLTPGTTPQPPAPALISSVIPALRRVSLTQASGPGPTPAPPPLLHPILRI